MKKKLHYLKLFLFLITGITYAQVGIGTALPDGSSMLDVTAINRGFLLPRMTTSNRNAIISPANGLIIYNTETNEIQVNKGTPAVPNWTSTIATSPSSDTFTGVLLPVNGGTGIANNNASTLNLSGAFATTFTTTATTNVTLPISGILYGTASSSINSQQVLTSLTDETGTGSTVFSDSPSLTLIPTAPTAAIGTNTKQLATTAFVLANSHIYGTVSSDTPETTSSKTDVLTTGMSITPPIPGTYIVTYNSQYVINSDNITEQAKNDVGRIYSQLKTTNTTKPTHADAFGTETLYSGVYDISAAGSLGGTITLDGQGNTNSVFIFKFGGALTIGANTTIKLTGGATASNVYWATTGAITAGASSVLKGIFISNAAVTLGATCNIEGRIFSLGANMTTDGDVIVIPSDPSSVNLGVLSTFAIFTSYGNLINTGVSNITGDIGTNGSAALPYITGFDSPTIVTGNKYTPAAPSNGLASFSVYQNGVLIANSTRTRTRNINTVDVSLQAIATVGPSEAIDIRCKVDVGSLTQKSRVLTVINVK